MKRLLLLVFLCSGVASAQTLDGYGGLLAKPSLHGATKHWRLEKFGNRWLFVTPAGNAFWMLSVYNVTPVNSSKYGSMSTWASQAVLRLRNWGFNALGEYTHIRAYPINQLQRMPVIYAFNSSYYSMQKGGIKNIYKGACCGVSGTFPDIFNPAYDTFIGQNIQDHGNNVWGGLRIMASTPWIIGFTTDDSDYLTGFGPGPEGEDSQRKCHPHLGWVAATMNPTQSGAHVYTKYAFRDYLISEYGKVSELNTAWSSTYTTFDSSGGWPNGTGVLDESGNHAWIGSDPCHLSGANARVKTDLDVFLSQIAEKYFATYRAKINLYVPNDLLFGPAVMQAGSRKQVLAAAGKYLDAIQSAGVPTGPSYPLYRKFYEYSGKPLFIWTTFTSQADSALTNPPPGWTSQYDYSTQQLRGQAYADELSNLFNLQGANGDYFILGIDWWEWVDKAGSGENMNFGLVTLSDNAYDGKEAIVAPGTDSRGFHTGGEKRNHGDFITAVVVANKKVQIALKAAVVAGRTSLKDKSETKTILHDGLHRFERDVLHIEEVKSFRCWEHRLGGMGPEL